ncbi:phage tail tape measure protein [Sporosarcina globispora]|uniref:phage tail tape measure protein n=1 Tax=Sporosarcina globispora TaxID=1459 RepID=UPI001EEF3666|nr:phage tail tape measure protein [Sporosarcina globispora]
MNGLKTIMSRITTMSEAETALNGVNIAIKDMGGNVRPVSSILEELAGKWTGLNDEQRQNLGVTLAGRYQLSRFLALMNNFSIATEATSVAMDSQGSSMREQAKYADSLEGRINRLDTAWNKLTLSAGSAVMTDGLIAIVESLNDLATISSKAIDTFGLLSGVFGTLGVVTVLLSSKLRNFAASLILGTQGMTRAQLASAGLTASMTRLGIATNGAKAALRGLVAATGVGLVFAGIGIAIEKLIGLYSDARQKQEEFEDSQKKNIEALTSNKQRTEELIDSYKKLSAQRNGDNWSNDKEKEYLQIQQQLGEIFPNLIEEMDATGQYHIKNAEEIDKEVQATKELLELKREEIRLNALNTFEENIDDREGFLGLEKKVEAKKKQLQDMAKHDFKQSYVNQVKQELLQLENELAQSSLKINDEVLKVAEAYNKLDIDPTISKNIQNFVNSLDLSDIDDPAKLEAYSIEISKFADAMQRAYESGDKSGFEKARNSLTSYAQKMGATKVEAESLDISFKKVKEENDRLANATYAGADGMGALETSMDGAGDSADKLAKSYDDAISNIESLNGIINDLNENHAVSADTISTMMEKYPELLAYIDDEAKLREEVNKLINAENDIALDAISKKLEGNEQYFTKIKKANNDLVNTLAKGYNVDLTNTKTLAQFKASINANLIKKLGSDWASYYDVQTRTFTEAGRKMMETMSYAEAANSPQLRAISEYEASMKSLTESLRSITAGSGFGNLDSSGIKDVASSTSKAYENATYVSDKFKIAIENVNFELEKQNQLQSKFPKHSKQYQNSIKKEIELMKQKKKLLEDQARSLNGQIRSGNIQQTGIIKGSGGGSSSYSTGSVTNVSNVSAADLNKYLKGKLSGMGNALIAAGKANGIDPAFLAAIAMHETGNGSSNAIRTKNNAFGIMSSKGGLRSFSSVAESIEYTADMLRRLYTSKGLTSVEAIQKKYAPVGVANDPTGLNKNWVNGVNKFWSQFTGTVNSVGASVASSASKSVADYYLKNFRVTSSFNEDRGSYNHKGLDLANGRQGDPVKALNNGKVITAAYSKSAGYWVVVQQDDGTVAKYMHMQKGLNVKAGQRVSAGQQLGKVGNTGQSTGAHLHLQIESGGKPVDPQTYMQQLSAVTSSSVADQMQLIDQAKSELIDLKMDALDIENQIAQLQMELINSQLAQYDLVVRQIQSHLKIYQANQNKYLESQSEYYKGNLQSQINLLTSQRKVYQDEMKFISDQVRLNKGLTEAQKSELEAKLLDVRDAFYDVHTQVNALEWEKTLASLARYGDEVEKLDYKLQLSKQQQELYNKASREYIDLQNHQKRYHHEKIVAMEREKAMIDQVRASQNLDEQQKKELNDRYLELKVSILEAQDAMQELANEASQLKLDNVLKQIEKVSEKISKQLDKIDDSIHMADPEDEEAILQLNRDRLDVLLSQRKAILENIDSLNAIRKELAGNDEALQQNAEEIQKWKDSLSDIDVSIFDQKESIEEIYESIADSYIEAMKEAYDAEREIKLKQLDDIRKKEEKAHNDKMKELDEQSKAIDEQYDKQLRALDDQEASDDYEKELGKKQTEAQKLQDKINALAMDDSEWAKKEKLRLEEELAEQLEDIEEFKNDRALELRRQALQDERDAKQEQLDKEREMENDAWEKRQEELDKQREQIEQFYEDLLEDEREWAKIREDIMNGNIDYYKDKLTEMAKYVSDNGKILGDSISKNIADALNRAKENISAISESIKKLFQDVDNTTSGQDKYAEDKENDRDQEEANQPEKNKTGKIIIKKPIKLWTRKNGKLQYVRGLNPGEVYRVYGYDDKWGGQFNVGKNHWVTNMPHHVQFQQFKSGGYTGNDEGLAMLHEKELVLNKEDTKNMLESVKLLRSMVKIPDLTSILGGLKLATPDSQIVYNLNFNIDTLTGDKQGGKVAFGELVKGLKKIGK